MFNSINRVLNVAKDLYKGGPAEAIRCFINDKPEYSKYGTITSLSVDRAAKHAEVGSSLVILQA